MNNKDLLEQPEAPTPVACSAFLDVPLFAKRHFIATTISKYPEKCYVCESCKTMLVDEIILPSMPFVAERHGANWCPVNESTFHIWRNLGTFNEKVS